MKMSQAFPSKYLKAGDLGDEDHPVVIDRVVMEEINSQNGATERKPCMYFQNRQKGLVLNLTNANTISDAYGDDSDDWIGQKVILFSTMTDFKGRMVEAIRVKVPKKAAAAPQAATRVKVVAVDELPEDEVPF